VAEADEKTDISSPKEVMPPKGELFYPLEAIIFPEIPL
jgi:hypothetical protein